MDETLFAILGLVCLAGVLFLGLATVVVVKTTAATAVVAAIARHTASTPQPGAATMPRPVTTGWGAATRTGCGPR